MWLKSLGLAHVLCAPAPVLFALYELPYYFATRVT